MAGNFGFASSLLNALKKHGNKCPVMLSSSIQATLIGRYAEGDYGKSKRAGEELFFDYSAETGAKVLVYRFPNLFGKWCRPNYNSAVATFCHNIAHDLPVQVNDRSTLMELVYIDDLVDEMIGALAGKEHHCEFDGIETVLREDGRYCAVPVSHHVTLGEIVDLLQAFALQPQTLFMPEIPEGSFAKKLYSTYLSYLPKEKVSFPLKMNVDHRGSFTELLKTERCGQFSVNISKPGITKGQHWHHTKWEYFIVVSGRGLIQLRRIDSDEVLDFEVSGDKIEAVHMLPGYTHNIINLSDTEDLVTLMWANESFDPDRPALPEAVAAEVEIQLKYAGYLQRQQKQVEEFKKEEARLLPDHIDYTAIPGLRLEAREKLAMIRPVSIGQAGRISGVSPADIAVLMIWLEQQR